MPAAAKNDVLAIGNAIVDIIARVEDDFLARFSLAKGTMQLADEKTAEAIFSAMGPTTVVSGGSAANSAVGVASLGGSASFIGKVRDDELGKLYVHDIETIGISFPVAPAQDGPTTARCYILVSPDSERTMNTYLGACQNLSAADIDEDAVRDSAIVYLEGYLWDPPAAKEAFRKAAEIAHVAGREVALTLSDPFCVDRYRDEFLQLLRSKTVDLVFANEHELKSLYQTADFDTALAAIRRDATTAVVTRSEKGAILVSGDDARTASAFPIETLVDTTGAGDLFAAGFLFGRARGFDGLDCLRLGALSASEVIQHIGARPQTSLRQLAQQNGLRI